MYLPLSRKYRPQDFDEIIGQEHITTTLKNAITMDKLAYAYLFTGTRGIGKTSTARVFAKALNCEKGPTEKPCNKCTACQEISKGISLDVLEIDGASNRGIDEIRNLRENVKLMPIHGKYKIYIIDEVHMLTPEAFNALLKTLEEPPDHVKFIFATTKAYKVLPTIVSRCQRFDFRAISSSVIVDKLKEITKEEKLDVQDDALFLLAKNADGSLRDAEMILDQLVNFTKGKVRGDDVSKMFGIIKQEAFLNLTEAILNSDSRAMLEIIDGLINNGNDAMFIATSLVEHFRNLLVILSCKDYSSHVIVSDEDKSRLEDLSHKFSIEELFYITYTLSNAIELIGKTSLGRIPLEVALIKLSRKEKMVPLSEVMKRLGELEALIQGTEDRGQGTEKRVKAEPPPLFDKKLNPEPRTLNPETFTDANTDALFQRLKAVWPEIIRETKSKKMSIGSYLGEGALLNFENNKVIVGFQRLNLLHKEVLDTRTNKDIIKAVIKQILEADLDIEFVISEIKEVKEAPQEPAENGVILPSQRKTEPIIESAIDIFNGRVVRESYNKEDAKQ